MLIVGALRDPAKLRVMTLSPITCRKPAKKTRAQRTASVSRSPERPWHSRKYAQISREWFDSCNEAFVAAMLANPSERP